MRYGAGHSVAPFDTFNLGLRSGDDADVVERNRAELVERFALPSRPRWLRQVHGTHVVVEPGADEPEADAAVTRHRGTVLAILTADCMPVVFASRDGDELGVAHAGWRGLAAGVLEATLAQMHAPRERIAAWLGPAAGQASYEVGAEVFDAFVSQNPAAAAAFIPTRPGHSRVDLYALARQRLAHAGVMDVLGGGFDTIGDARFFSHRRDRRTGRMATIAWLR
ncbi:peptidoglycan editing factor PgeF [Lysobacter sp. A6]|uniref:Purine nucleoside phosphorylase n=1 Tax=Noviluteimonas lactosilytica TaxID=2888523 RepID=A0ABS8JFZ0_9GAMM|nr:peptidoglycan editing factor PgeF [Lysobacter lactosilyticus]MCC8362477.1 peptidoglycan editing factor PgeF [Lysobacter lactosilyticus]